MKRTFVLIFTTLFVVSSYSLTSGPTQPDYSGFKASNAEGLVDLLSGDLSYTIPLVEVPGPEFSLPLTLGYTSGVQLEQEATWVGLGWSLSPGAISRNMNRYPDDYLRGFSKSELKADNVVTGWDASVHLQIDGIGGGVNFGERSDQGSHFGLDIMGTQVFDWNKRDGFDILPANFPTTTFGTVMYMAGKSLGNLGISLNNPALKLGLGEYGSIGFASQSLNAGAFHRESMSIGLNIKIGKMVDVSLGYSNETAWIYKKEEDQLYGYLNLSQFPKEKDDGYNFEINGKDNWETKNHKMEYTFVPEMNREALYGVKDDIFTMFTSLKAFPMNTPDGFSASGEGISSFFRAYRQDIGDYFGMDRHESPVPTWFSWVKSQWWSKIVGIFINLDQREEEIRNSVNGIPGEYATSFVSENESYYGSPIVQFREAGAPGGTFITENWRDVWDYSKGSPTDGASEHTRGLQRNTVRQRKFGGFKDYRNSSYNNPYLPTWNEDTKEVEWVEWNTGREHLKDKITTATGIIPVYKEQYDTTQGDDSCRVPYKALVGFTIRRADGMIYEYHKPVFNWYTKVNGYVKDDSEDRRNYNDYDFGDYRNYSTMERAYAYTWLLTAIKSPDYFDYNGNNIVDKGDWGGWVRLDYNEHIPVYFYRTPYEGMTPTGEGTDVTCAQQYYNSYGSSSWGIKEIYYLTDISTSSHHARFILGDRDDGAQAPGENIEDVDLECSYNPINRTLVIKNCHLALRPGDQIRAKLTYGSASLTKEITGTIDNVVRKNGTEFSRDNGSLLQTWVTVKNVNLGNVFNVICANLVVTNRVENPKLKRLERIQLYRRDITLPSDSDDKEMIKEVRFKYANDFLASDPRSKELCPNIPNTFRTGAGKLTLRELTIGDGTNFLPPYQFQYYKEGNEAPYERLAWDRWGYYKHDGGLICTTIDRKNVTNWDALLDTIQNSSSYWGAEICDTLRKLINNREYNHILNAASAEDLLGKHKTAIGEALNRIIHNLEFFKNHQNRTDIKTGLQAAVTDNKYPDVKKIWEELINKDHPKAPSIRKLMDIDGNLLSPSTFNRFDSNAIYLFNLAVYSQYALLSISRDDIDEVVRAKDRIVLTYLEIDRFDHETNVDDVDAWSLKNVVMPSGGQLSFTYESDDYSFVGRAKMTDQLEIFGESLQDAVENKLDKTGYYKRFNMEKDLLSKNNLFRIRGWSKELSNFEKILKHGNRDTNNVEFRVSSLFRIYRNVSDDPEHPNYQLNEEFIKLKQWKENGLLDDEHRLHLIGLFDPTQFVAGGIMFTGSMECGMEIGQSLSSYHPIVPIPVDLGPVQTENDSGFVFPTIEQMNTNPEIAAKYACQRGYVDFKFEKMRKGKFFQFRKIQDTNWERYCGSCVMQEGNILGEELQVPEKGTCNNQNASPPFFFEMTWGRKVDFNDPNDFELDDKVAGEYYKTYSYGGKSFYQLCKDGEAYNCYKYSLDGGPNTHKGYFAWNYMQEFNISNTDSKQDNPGAFSKGYWDYYSTDMFVKNDDAELVSNGVGIPGGGLRVKKLVYNTGWPQEKAAPSNARVVEYSYVCEASDGTKGSMSSGATPSMPPPFSNKGDDRPDLPPQVSFLRGGPSVRYGTVHEERKGRGRIVRNFLTCADVGDFMTDDTLNYWIFDKKIGDVRKVDGAYDTDEFDAQWPGNPHHRYRLHRCSHFQGLPVDVKKYSEDNKLVESTSYKYLTSLTNTDICNIDLLSKLNGVNGRASAVLISQDDLKLFAGKENYKLLRHPLSKYVGTTTERFRMKWIEKLPKTVYNSSDVDEDDFNDYFDGKSDDVKRSLHDLVGIIEMEVLEHSIRQYSSTDLQYAGRNPKFGNGVGTRTVQSYFDFLTGSPLVTTVMEANSEQQNSCGCSDAVASTSSDEDDHDVINPLTKVTIPQYWVSADFKDKNMLTQTYSISQYEGLGPLECTSDDCEADEVAQQWHDKLKPAAGQEHVLLSRSITNWYETDAVDTNRYRKKNEMQLRVNLRVDQTTGKKSIDLSDAMLNQIGYPYDPVSNPDLYTTDKVYARYDVYGHLLEERDANNTPVANFYTLNDYGLSKAAVVLNASRNASAVMTVDEVAGENGDVPFNWPESFGGSGTINTEHSRSGRKSLNLGANSVIVNTNQHDTGMSFTLSFWVRNPQNLAVNGILLTDGQYMMTYDPAGPEWQKMWTDVEPSSTSITISGSAGQIDDIRLFPKDAHVFSMTYDNRGKMTSFDDQNDNIWYYIYDAFGNLTEVRDRQKMIVSTQSRVEAKR